jgi:hypothetical protein
MPSGAKAGTIVSIRELNAKVTDPEKKNMCIMEITMTAQEAKNWRKEMRPRAFFFNINTSPDPKTEEAAYNTFMVQERAVRRAKYVYGMKVDMQAPEIQAKMADLTNPNKKVEPFPVNKTHLKKITAIGP